MKKSLWKKVLAVLALIFVAIQFIPYGRDHDNPPATNNVNWDSPQTKETFYTACADCHSNETVWPWYSNIAPASWLVQYDVEEARSHFNISEEDGLGHADEAYELVEAGEMPLWYFVPLHSEANLSKQEKIEFITGLKTTFPKETKSSEEEGEDPSHEDHEH